MKDSDIQIDAEREQRLGFDEAVYAAGKSAAQLQALVADALATGTPRLFTRMGPEQHAALPDRLRTALDYDAASRIARLGQAQATVGAPPGAVAVVTGGSSDVPVALEAVHTLAYYGQQALYMPDIGIAGLWRLMRRVDELRQCAAVIVVAGMEGALTSVVGGLVPGLVIATPTSVGYGVSAGGQTALASALASCAPGIVTVNIDNGYGAACAALRLLRVAYGAAPTAMHRSRGHGHETIDSPALSLPQDS